MSTRSGSQVANNFDVIRLLAAWLVLLSHSYHLSGSERLEPMLRLSGGRITLGTCAVGVFFAISGYLITASAFSRPSFPGFLLARARRIFPALLLVVCLSALVLGPLFSTLSVQDYFASPDVAAYVLRNITLWHLKFDLPEVFTLNPYPRAVNGSLWTLPIEFALYLGVGGCVWLLRRLRLAAVWWLPLALSMLVCLACWSLVLQGNRAPMLLLVPYFMLGAAYRLAQRYVPLRGDIALGWLLLLVAVVVLDLPGFAVVASIAISYATLWFARHPRWTVPFSTDKVGDLSYGIYLFAFPVQQGIVALGYATTAPVLCLGASLATFPLAWMSWHLVERRFVATQPAAVAPRALGEVG